MNFTLLTMPTVFTAWPWPAFSPPLLAARIPHLEIKQKQIELAALAVPHWNANGFSDHSLPRPEYVNSQRTNLSCCLCFAQVVTSLILCSLLFLLFWPLPALS